MENIINFLKPIANRVTHKKVNVGADIEQSHISNVKYLQQNAAVNHGKIINENAKGVDNTVANTPSFIGQDVTQGLNKGFTSELARAYFGGSGNQDFQA